MQNKMFSKPGERITPLSHPVGMLTTKRYKCELSDLTGCVTEPGHWSLNHRPQTEKAASEWRLEE